MANDEKKKKNTEIEGAQADNPDADVRVTNPPVEGDPQAPRKAQTDRASRSQERQEETQPNDPGINTGASRAGAPSGIQFAEAPTPIQQVKVTVAGASDDEKRRGLNKFLSESGYKEKDVIAWNAFTQTAVTSNGGKYLLRNNGKIRHLQGPATPKERKKARVEPDQEGAEE